ncbi:hypothetical protein CPB84DRAFT_1788944 [Gymnopilus junonius]|uniref:Uncharacterized protein n=1 Tax=Gymnopilus junonius TaxID=109634 RepID=A0A9P5NE01_GYMJU|nr:hypothetical protein CPB84DRAFT_1788944 [Gymnopilus junonius]
MVAPELPYDITFNVAQYFDDSAADRRSLIALGLSCKSFLPISQERLFSSITLKEESSFSDSDSDSGSDSNPDHNRTWHLAKILESSPHIRHYIRSLTYKKETQSNEQSHSQSFDSAADIISVLPRLQELRLSFYSGFDWSSDLLFSSAQKFAKAVQDAVTKPSLLTLHLKEVSNFPISYFTNRCQELVLAENGPSSLSLSVGKPTDKPTASPAPVIQIRNYEVGKESWPRRMQHKTIDGIHFLVLGSSSVPPLDLQFLQELSVKFTAEQDLQEAKQIQALAPSISSIHVEVDRSSNFKGVPDFLLGNRSTLQTLTLSFAVRCRNDPWSSLSRALAALEDQNLPALRKLVISTSHCSCGNIPSSELERLDKILSDGGFPSLRSVVFNIKVTRSQLEKLDIPGVYRQYFSRVDDVDGLKLKVSPELQQES